MNYYESQLHAAKDAVTDMLHRLVAKEAGTPCNYSVVDLATRIENLNKAWDELTDHLVRQRSARDETIDYLHNRIAELTKEGK